MNEPPVCAARRRRSSGSAFESTGWPLASLLKPLVRPAASTSGTGAPVPPRAPTKTACTVMPSAFARAIAASTPPSRSSPSEKTTAFLPPADPAGNRSAAAARPEASDVPGLAPMPGSIASRKSPTAAASRVRGTRAWASPSQAINAARSLPRRDRRDCAACRARTKREGETSAARIEAEVSRTKTTSAPRRCAVSVVFPQRGRASAPPRPSATRSVSTAPAAGKPPAGARPAFAASAGETSAALRAARRRTEKTSAPAATAARRSPERSIAGSAKSVVHALIGASPGTGKAWRIRRARGTRPRAGRPSEKPRESACISSS